MAGRSCRRRHLVRGFPGAVLAALVVSATGASLSAGRGGQFPVAGAQLGADAVTIRQNNVPAGPRGIRSSAGGRIEVRGLTLNDLVRFVYGQAKYQASQIVGGAPWTGVQRFDVDAIGKGDFTPQPGATAPPEALVATVRGILETRFKLKARQESREQDHFVLARANPDSLGPQMKPRAGCRPPSPGIAPDAETCNLVTATPGVLTARAVGMDQLAVLLGGFPSIARLVRNGTGLTGLYDMDMTYVPEFINAIPGGKPVPNPNVGSGPTIFAAFEQQLGLKLESRRGPVDVVVIESAEMP